MVKHAITWIAFLLASDGLWSHDWRMIFAGVATALIWPLVNADLEAAQHEVLLDRIWDDEAGT